MIVFIVCWFNKQGTLHFAARGHYPSLVTRFPAYLSLLTFFLLLPFPFSFFPIGKPNLNNASDHDHHRITSLVVEGKRKRDGERGRKGK